MHVYMRARTHVCGWWRGGAARAIDLVVPTAEGAAALAVHRVAREAMQAQRGEPEGVVAREEDPAVAHAAACRLARLEHSQRHPLLEQPRRHLLTHLTYGDAAAPLMA